MTTLLRAAESLDIVALYEYAYHSTEYTLVDQLGRNRRSMAYLVAHQTSGQYYTLYRNSVVLASQLDGLLEPGLVLEAALPEVDACLAVLDIVANRSLPDICGLFHYTSSIIVVPLTEGLNMRVGPTQLRSSRGSGTTILPEMYSKVALESTRLPQLMLLYGSSPRQKNTAVVDTIT